MYVRLYQMDKRNNSDRLPGPNDPYLTVSNVVFNDDNTSLVDCNLRFGNMSYINYNYCYIEKFKRYYWIKNWTMLSSGLAVATCHIDVLGSWKNQIRTSQAYIERCSNPYKIDDLVSDNYYPSTNKVTFAKVEQTNSNFSDDADDWTYIIGVINTTTPNFGAMDYYGVTRAQLQVLLTALLTNYASNVPSNWSATSLTDDMLKTLVSPMQYIKTCIAFPFSATLSGSTTTIYAGTWSTGAQGVKLSSTSTNVEMTTTIYPSGLFNDYLNNHEVAFYAPYAKYTLYNNLFGVFDIDPGIMTHCALSNHSGALKLKIAVNLITGIATLKAYMQDNTSETAWYGGYMLFKSDAKISMDIPIADISYNYLGMAKSAVSAVGNAASWTQWADPGSNLARIAGDAIDAVSYALSPAVASTSMQSGNCVLDPGLFTLQAIYYNTVEQKDKIFGKPAMKYDYISSFKESNRITFITAKFLKLSKLTGGQNSYAMTDDESAEIKTMLARGIYMEDVNDT